MKNVHILKISNCKNQKLKLTIETQVINLIVGHQTKKKYFSGHGIKLNKQELKTKSKAKKGADKNQTPVETAVPKLPVLSFCIPSLRFSFLLHR